MDFSQVNPKDVKWRKINSDGLDLDYAVILKKSQADELFSLLESTVEYYDSEITKVKVFGKWHPTPRQMVAFGDPGLKYRFSGITMPAIPWSPPLAGARDLIGKLTGHKYNFVLVNRLVYCKNGVFNGRVLIPVCNLKNVEHETVEHCRGLGFHCPDYNSQRRK